MFDFIVANKEIFKLFYGLIILFICIFIVLRSDKLFRLSNHNGIRYFRNAFFFYGIAFAIRYLLGTPLLNEIIIFRIGITKFLFEFFMTLAGFFLLYSLMWKRLEYQKQNSSLFNLNVLIFYLMAFIIAFIDYILTCYFFLFASQIILFFILFIISYYKYLEKRKNNFLRFYFLVMVLSLSAWVLNILAATIFQWHSVILIIIYGLNVVVFLSFLYGVIKIIQS